MNYPSFKQVQIPKELRKFCRTTMRRVREDWDLCIGITGPEGVGKSTLAILLGLMMDEKFQLERNELFQPTSKEVFAKIENLPKYSVIIADEAIRILYKLRWSEKGQKYINTVYGIARQENHISVFCMPRFKDFNEYFRNHRLKVWIHVYARGKAIIFTPDENPFVDDPYWFKESMKYVDKAMRRLKSVKLTDKIVDKVISKCRCFLMVIEFPQLPEDIEINYKELKKTHKYYGLKDEMLEEDTSQSVQRNRLLIFLRKYMTIPPKQLARLVNMPVYSMNSVISYTLLTEADEKLFKSIIGDYNTVILKNQQKRTKIVDIPLEAQPSRFEPAKERSQGNSDPGGEGNAED